MNLPTIGIQQCPCTPTCRTYFLTGVGRFAQGSGFDKAEAEEVARRLNCHDDLVAALRACSRRLEALSTSNICPELGVAEAALAKAGVR